MTETDGAESANDVRELIEERLKMYEQQLQKTNVQAGEQLALPVRTPVKR